MTERRSVPAASLEQGAIPHERGHAPVRDLNVLVGIQQQILWFQVSMTAHREQKGRSYGCKAGVNIIQAKREVYQIKWAWQYSTPCRI